MKNNWIHETRLRSDQAITDAETIRIKIWATENGFIPLSQVRFLPDHSTPDSDQLKQCVSALSHNNEPPSPIFVFDGTNYICISSPHTVHAYKTMRREWIKPGLVINSNENLAQRYVNGEVPQIDLKLADLLGQLSESEFAQLRDSILAEGQKEPIIVWQENNIVVDGHNRYRICLASGIEPKFVYQSFDDEAMIIEWMIKRQFGRRNLNMAQRIQVIYNTVYPQIKQLASQRQSLGVKQDDTERTDEKCGELCGCSAGTWRRALKVLSAKIDYVTEAWLDESISTSAASNLVSELVKYSPDTIAMCAKEKVFNVANLPTIAKIVKNKGDTYQHVQSSGYVSSDQESVNLNDDNLPDVYKRIADFNRSIAIEEKLLNTPREGFQLVYINLIATPEIDIDNIVLSNSLVVAILCSMISLNEAIDLLHRFELKVYDVLLVDFVPNKLPERLVSHKKSLYVIGRKNISAQTLRLEESAKPHHLHQILNQWYPNMSGIDLSTKHRGSIPRNWTLVLEDTHEV